MTTETVICTKTFRGSPKGHTTYQYNPGDPVPAELAEWAVSAGMAEVAKVKTPDAKKPATENKAVKPKENKAKK